ncbi:hypothetical protein [Pseudomonas quasicaspiana]|uniref:hypothetical protein n=1 Tax=Pseudomonas quasicaspiana TaxID=2829821 RepID=UPI001E4E6F87|nr:hypothetical protein [Pseudomonas quasicaspiana]MCD5970935.1 hypothetical protein [Pseudomonas quasicaspiana]MCD5976696.1 hypothetical protein [Pseudomonas quasicaspiana]
MTRNTYVIVPTPLLERLAATVAPQANESLLAALELQELLARPTELSLTADLRFILSRPSFGCQSTAQVLRRMGHTIAERAEDEQAATIHWLLNHYLRDPHNWRINSLEEFNAVAATLNNADGYL